MSGVSLLACLYVSGYLLKKYLIALSSGKYVDDVNGVITIVNFKRLQILFRAGLFV